MPVILYSGSEGVGSFLVAVLEFKSNRMSAQTLSNLEKVKREIFKNFEEYKQYQTVTYRNINVVNTDVNDKSHFFLTLSSLEPPETKQFLSSEYDWILKIILMLALAIIIISFVNSYFFPYITYDLKWYHIFGI